MVAVFALQGEGQLIQGTWSRGSLLLPAKVDGGEERSMVLAFGLDRTYIDPARFPAWTGPGKHQLRLGSVPFDDFPMASSTLPRGSQEAIIGALGKELFSSSAVGVDFMGPDVYLWKELNSDQVGRWFSELPLFPGTTDSGKRYVELPITESPVGTRIKCRIGGTDVEMDLGSTGPYPSLGRRPAEFAMSKDKQDSGVAQVEIAGMEPFSTVFELAPSNLYAEDQGNWIRIQDLPARRLILDLPRRRLYIEKLPKLAVRCLTLSRLTEVPIWSDGQKLRVGPARPGRPATWLDSLDKCEVVSIGTVESNDVLAALGGDDKAFSAFIHRLNDDVFSATYEISVQVEGGIVRLKHGP